MPGRGSVSTVEKRRQCIAIVYDDLLWNALVFERASKQFGHVHTLHRSSSSMGLAGAGGGFPVTRELKLIQTQMAQKPMLRAEVGMRVRCANKASAG